MKNAFLNVRGIFALTASLVFCISCSDGDKDDDGPVAEASVISVIPAAAPADTEIKIVGRNFTDNVRDHVIYINNTAVTPYEVIKAPAADTLYAAVPVRLGSGKVEVSVKGTRFTSDISFEYLKQMKFGNIIGAVWGMSWGVSSPSDPKFNGAIGACMGTDGRILLAEQWQHCIREINPIGGTIALYAGTYGAAGETPGSLLSSKIDTPKGIVSIGTNKWLVFSDRQLQVIGNGTVSLLGKKRDDAGTRIYSGPVENVQFSNTSGAAYDAASNCVYLGCGDIDAASGRNFHYIQKLNLSTGTVSVVAGTTTGSDSQNTIDGEATTVARVDCPSRMCMSNDGSLYFLQSAGNGKSCVRKLKDGVITTIAGQPGEAAYADGTGNTARFNFICEGGEPGGGIVGDEDGNFLIADPGNHAIRKMTPAGIVTTVSAMEENGPNKWAYKDDYDPSMGNKLGASQFVAHPMYIFKISEGIYGFLQYTGDAPGVRKITFE